ncbi:S-adenosyl-L-methionine-dependent methyltransferase [Crucibulum laeve]|uniref:S-adenosyl-L-methionine-dependent methyltransferase n=1 Tax=Crucibulum laeve TaxID=68775 RepID=A0A5C3LZL1_9AGAR|nr:S-adenosyl-L-methionine-dependent methyltransferase [Crucibulum laeve]
MRNRLTNLRQLATLINEQVDFIENLAEQQGVNYPTIDTIFNECNESEKFTTQAEVFDASLIAISAASQLIATLKLPVPALYERATGYHISSALRIASEVCAVELLRDAGPKGMHVKDIAAATETNATMLGRCLRILATHYVFKEVEPNVFANNRLSSMMDTGKDSKFLVKLAKMANPSPLQGVSTVRGEKYINTNSVVALLDISTDYIYKATSYIPDVFLSNTKSRSAFQTSINYDGSLWDFFEEHPHHLQRFQISMEAWTRMNPANLQSSLKGFDWSTLPTGATVVDVGGGNGSVSFDIAKRAPHINIVVQDRVQTIKDVTIPTWQADPEKNELLKSKRVSLEGHSFFDDQPSHLVGKVDVYFMRYILHDWSAAESAKILKRIHAAASKSTKLLIIDQVVPYACPTQAHKHLFEGSNLPQAPYPLLANLGEANSPTYRLDIAMEALFNGQERTLGEFQELTEGTGWRIEKIFQTKGSNISQILCTKV